jgi:HD superfamily phosphohydrolase
MTRSVKSLSSPPFNVCGIFDSLPGRRWSIQGLFIPALNTLGVLHVTTLLYDALVRRSKDVLKRELGYDDAGLARHRSLVRLVALLHDVGHGPFSHAAEELTPSRPDGRKYVHEEYSAAIIRTHFKELIENHAANKNHGFRADDVAALLEGTTDAGHALFWRGLISGQLDADRMDYLLRDSLHAGVRYGNYDLNRLVNVLEVIPSSEESDVSIGIGSDGVHAAEALILARYFMFTQVYFHKTRVIYDHHLEEALREILPGGLLPPPTPKGLSEYIKWDDWRVYGKLSDGKGGEHGKILRTRDTIAVFLKP